MSTYPPYVAYPSAPPMVRAVPNPPRLHWGLVLVLSIFTLGYFSSVWYIVQSVWVRKVYGRSKALPWAIVNACALPGFIVFVIGLSVFAALTHMQGTDSVLSLTTTFARILLGVLGLVTAFTLRSELESSPINIPLGGVMTFFFGAVYFQYQLYDYQVPDEVHLFRGEIRPVLTDGPAPPPSA